MNRDSEFLNAIECHAVEELQGLLDGGLDVRSPIRGKSATVWLTEMYARSDRFPDCLRLLLDRGAVLDDPLLEPVLMNDAAAVRKAAPSLLAHRTSLVSAFTPLDGATALHVAAEFGHAAAARALIEAGADVNARAAVDEDGFNGQTPIFHAVNSNANRSAPIMRMLLDAGAKADVRLDGITWGRGFEWETTFLDVTPLSYCQAGLFPQMHRNDGEITDNLRVLLVAAGRRVPPFANVPNRYLKPKGK